jgi:hypothetical protein
MMLTFRSLKISANLVLAILLATVLIATPVVAAPIINEFVANHNSTDSGEYVEIYGDPNTDYSAYTIVEVEGEGTATGLIDTVIVPVGTTDGNGFWTHFVGGSGLLEKMTLTRTTTGLSTHRTGVRLSTALLCEIRHPQVN